MASLEEVTGGVAVGRTVDDGRGAVLVEREGDGEEGRDWVPEFLTSLYSVGSLFIQ